MTLSRLLFLTVLALTLGALAACGGGGGDGPAYTAGPLACGGLGTKSYTFTTHATEEVVALTGSPAPGSGQPHTALKVVWDITGSVEGGSSLSNYGIHEIINNSVGTAVGKTESIVLTNGDGYINIGSGWQPAGTKPPTLLHRPSTLCSSLSQDLDTTKLGASTTETINGVSSLKFSFQNVPSEFLSRDPDFGNGSDAAVNIHTVSGSIWVAEKGDMVTKMDITAAGAYSNGQPITVTMQYELKDVGSGVKVEKPI